MKIAIMTGLILAQSLFSLSWASSHELSLSQKVEMLKNLDIEKASLFLSPEVTELTRQFQKHLADNPGVSYSDPQFLPGTVVSIAMFVAARTYGDFIRGHGKTGGDFEFNEVADEFFDINGVN